MQQIFSPLIPLPHDLEINLYFDAAAQVLQGRTPYLDFTWLYPPGHLLIVTLIKLFFPQITSFIIIYFLLLLASALFIALRLYQIATQKYKFKRPNLQIFTVIISILLLLTVNKAFINPDLIVAIFILIAFLNFPKTTFAILFLGIAASIRLYPAIYLFLFITIPLFNKQNFKKLIIFIIPTILSLLVFLNTNIFPAFINQSVLVQAKRNVEIESFSASLMHITQLLGLPPTNGLSVVPDPIQYDIKLLFNNTPSYWNILNLITWIPLILIIFYLYKKRFKLNNPVEFHTTALLLTLALIIKHPVFSPQYLIWLWIPFFLWLIHSTINIKTKITTLTLFLLAHFITTIYLINFLPQRLTQLISNPNPTLNLISSRNITLLALFFIIYFTSISRQNHSKISP
jgi:hypothetical protein